MENLRKILLILKLAKVIHDALDDRVIDESEVKEIVALVNEYNQGD